MSESETLYEKILSEDEAKGFQLRLVVNLFKDVQYIHIRKYFLSFEDGYVPSKEGISIPATISNIFALLDGLMEICSYEEDLDLINKYFSDKIIDLKSKSV
jgi:hypothetical protein